MIVAIVCSEAKENIMKSLSNFRLIKTRVFIKASLISSKDFLASMVHFMVEYFFNILFNDLINYAKLEINLLRKLIFPKNSCNALMILGCCICNIASILAEYIRIPSLEIM